MSFVSTGLNYTKEEIEINGNQVPLGKLHDEVCNYMESEWKASESEILNISTALWKALEVLNNELIKKDEQFKNEEECWLITVKEREERIKELEDDVEYFKDKFYEVCENLKCAQDQNHYYNLMKEYRDKYQEAVKDIEFLLKWVVAFGDDPVMQDFKAVAKKYGLDKQERNG